MIIIRSVEVNGSSRPHQYLLTHHSSCCLFRTLRTVNIRTHSTNTLSNAKKPFMALPPGTTNPYVDPFLSNSISFLLVVVLG